MTEVFQAQEFVARVVKHEPLTSKFHWVELLLEQPTKIDFRAGQYLSLKVAPDKHNNYSITTPPRISDRVAIVVDVSPAGKGTDYVFKLKVGDRAEFVAPLGKFTFRDDGSEKLLFVATGSGISPLRSIILDRLEKGESRPIELYFGLRYEEDIFFFDFFKKLSQNHPNFSLHLCISQPGDAWVGRRGRVTEHIEKEINDWPVLSAYLCGNGAMIADASQLLEKKGMPKERIYTEKFFDTPAPGTRPPHYGENG